MVVHKDTWDPGTPCWVDIMVGDLPRSQAFYSSVLGWDYTESLPEYGGYCNATVRGEVVAGMSPTMPGMEAAPHVWTTYLATDDAEATKAAVLGAGGQVMVEPMVVGSFGTMAVYVDPTGTAFGAWQSGENTGFDLANEPGGVFWNDAMVGDFETGKDFYAKVFGYQYSDMSTEDTKYAALTLDGQRPVGGIGVASGGAPPHWSVTFSVEDADEAVARVTEQGGGVVTPAFDIEWGRIAFVSGPDGETFGVMGAKKE